MVIWMGSKSRRTAASTKQAHETLTWYDKIAAAMQSNPDCLSGPSPLFSNIILSCSRSSLEPKDETKRPLLALARGRPKWFERLSLRCDPGVSWKEGGRETTLGEYLHGSPTYTIWLQAMNKWKQDHRHVNQRGSQSSTHEDNYRWWWSQFGVLAGALGLTTAAVTTALLGGFAFPAMAVGSLVWTAVRNWHGGFENKIRQSPDGERLLGVFRDLSTVVGTTINKLNTKIQEAEEDLRSNPEGASEELSRQRFRVVLLQTFLDREVAKIQHSEECDADKIFASIERLFDFQRKLQEDLYQERVSDDLQRLVDVAERLEGLVGDIFRASSMRRLPDVDDGTPGLTPTISDARAGARSRSNDRTINGGGTRVGPSRFLASTS